MLERYWPEADAVNACIKNEAETADVSVLLAVHQPSPLEQRHAGSSVRTPSTEMDLLEAFLTDNVPGGALLMPITGPSGIGKSHMIRWLDAQLRRSAKRDQFHIIRIPKSASLRTVVELILAPLANDQRYAKAREGLTRAVTEVSVTDAVRTFRAHLENALNARRERMVFEYRENPERTHLKALIGHAGMLPRLFTDAAFDRYFVENILSRVVARALGGRPDDVQEDAHLPQFAVDDLILPKSVDISQSARPVHDYYIRNIVNVGRERLQPIVDLLNDVVDTAIGNVFQLEQSTGGVTLQDIILAVRQILFEDGKDLVLLVEDFAALAGIQEVLLKVCIHEGEYEGKKVRATMRTAMALTDGYLNFRDTILTRAQREWVIGGRPQSDEEIRAGVVEIVGAYMNAARWGEAELRRRFDQRDPEMSLTDWLPAWRDEALTETESEAVTAFGFNARGHALFPFNRYAVEQLANRHLMLGGSLVFNPRRVINEILRNTLLLREQFVTNNFPPTGFQNLGPTTYVANWVTQAHQPDPVARRLKSLLAIWGGNPPDAAGIAHIPPAIFTAFSLPTPATLGDISFVPEPRPPVSVTQNGAEGASATGKEQLADATAAPEDSKVADMRTKLEKWAGGAMLEQKDANELRKALCEMIRDCIDWPRLRIRSVEIRPSWISVPQARGNPQSGRQLMVCDDARDETGATRAGLLGAFRFAMINGKRWYYPEADDDYVASAAIVDHLIVQLMPMLVADAKAQASTLGRALIIQSRIAGLEPSVRPSGVDTVLTSLFAMPAKKEIQAFEENWDKLRAHALGSIGGKPARDVLQAELLARVGSFQGDSGRTPFAIDIARLLDTVGGEASTSETADGFSEEVRTFIRPIAESRLWAQLAPVVARLTTFRSQIADYIDEGFDKAVFIADLQEIVRLLGATGTTPTTLPMSVKEFERRLIEFQGSAIKDLVGKAGTIIESGREQIPKLLNALGAIDLGLIDRTMSFLTYTTTLINAAEVSVAREETNRNQVDPDVLAGELKGLLHLLAGQSVSVAEAAQ